VQQHGERGQQHHERRRAVPGRGPPHGVGQLLRHDQRQCLGGEVGLGRAGAEARQLQRFRQVGQFLAPVLDVPGRRGDVAVGHRGPGQRHVPAVHRGLVTARQLVLDHRDRRAVDRDVVHQQHELVPVVVQAQQDDPQRQPAGDVDAASEFVGHQRLRARRSFGGGQLAQVARQDRHVCLQRDLGHELGAVEAVAGAQRLVPVHHRGQRGGERVGVQLAGDLHEHRHGVERGVRRQLVGEPDLLLATSGRGSSRKRILLGHCTPSLAAASTTLVTAAGSSLR
jgi:hypothetical protein